MLFVELIALAGQRVDAALVVDQQLRAVEDHDVVLERHPLGVAVLKYSIEAVENSKIEMTAFFAFLQHSLRFSESTKHSSIVLKV